MSIDKLGLLSRSVACSAHYKNEAYPSASDVTLNRFDDVVVKEQQHRLSVVFLYLYLYFYLCLLLHIFTTITTTTTIICYRTNNK
jgi:hypothetical protein